MIAGRCPALPFSDHSSLLTYDNSIHGSAVYQCNHGYRYPNGAIQHTIKCEQTKEWTDLPPCIGMSFQLQYGFVQFKVFLTSFVYEELSIYFLHNLQYIQVFIPMFIMWPL